MFFSCLFIWLFYLFSGTRHTRGRDIPLDSDDEDLTDDEDYRLPSKGVTIEDTDSETDLSDKSEDEEILTQDALETIYLEEDFEYESMGSAEAMTDILEASTSTGIMDENRKTQGKTKKKVKKDKLTWTDNTITYDSEDVAFMGCTNLPDNIMSLETPISFFQISVSNQCYSSHT